MKTHKKIIKCDTGDVTRIAIFSDLHADDKGCNVNQLTKDLKTEVEKGSMLFFNGDLFSAIIMQDRKRATAARLEGRDDQLNYYIDKVFNILVKVVDNIEYIGIGNHEESIIKYNGIDILAILIDKLNDKKTNGSIFYGDYQNYYRLAFKGDRNPNYCVNYDIRFNHGQGGAAPVTKGILNASRTAVRSNANLIVEGHSHNAIIDYGMDRDALNQNAEIVIERCAFMVVPSYLRQIDIQKKPTHSYNWAESSFRGIPAGNGYGVVELKTVGHNGTWRLKTRIMLEMGWN